MTAPTITRGLTAEYQVRGTCLDSEGDEQRATEPVDGIHAAHIECARFREYQERWDLPVNAEIWWRPGVGHAWQRWAPLAEQAGASA